MGGREKKAAPHPGEVLREKFMAPAGLSANALALRLRVAPNRISEIVRERRGVTGETALRLARHFGTTPAYWMNLQAEHDLARARAAHQAKIEKQVLPARLTRAGPSPTAKAGRS